MSFKREGNDSSLLETLRKRRIMELLSEDIPEDEAKLLCNGRFACTVCANNPIFDTVNMLSVHRKGKKHLLSMENHDMKKRELKQLIAARKQEQFLKDGTSFIKMALPDHKSILTASRYDPRVKRSKVKHGDRKPTIDLNICSGLSSRSAVLGIAEKDKDLWLTTCEQQMHGPIIHSHQIVNIFGGKKCEPFRLTPYQSKQKTMKCDTKKSALSKCISHTIDQNMNGASSFPVTTAEAPYHTITPCGGVTTKQLFRSPAFPRDFPGSNPTSSMISPLSDVVFADPPPPPNQKASLSGAMNSAPPCPPLLAGTGSTYTINSDINFSSRSHQHSVLFNKETGDVAQKLKQLQGSGWKRDWDGKWIKDENAEFDSDEEPPNIP